MAILWLSVLQSIRIDSLHTHASFAIVSQRWQSADREVRSGLPYEDYQQLLICLFPAVPRPWRLPYSDPQHYLITRLQSSRMLSLHFPIFPPCAVLWARMT